VVLERLQKNLIVLTVGHLISEDRNQKTEDRENHSDNRR
jgi:hypothetical protein